MINDLNLGVHLVPIHHRLWFTTGFAVEGHRLVPKKYQNCQKCHNVYIKMLAILADIMPILTSILTDILAIQISV